MSRAYKSLSSAQQIKARALTAKGVSQKDIARALGVSKQRIVNYQKLLPPEYRPRPPQPLTGARLFWAQVKQLQKATKITHKEAIREIYKRIEWAAPRAKRHGRIFKPEEEFWAEVRKEHLNAQQRKERYYEYYGEEGIYEGKYPISRKRDKGIPAPTETERVPRTAFQAMTEFIMP